MENKNKAKDPLPDSFASAEEAGEFWDTHSTMDYVEYLEPADDIIEIKKRILEVQVAEDIFQKLRQEAESAHESVPKVVDQILRKQLILA
ncbi:MAG: CopG family antitoxin [Pyrinomonadaceae bacterium]